MVYPGRTNITTNSAVLNWSVTAGNFYTIDYRVSGVGTWVMIAAGISTGSVSITNLVPATFYDWRVSVNCAASPVSNYATSQFSTKAHNSQISNFKDGYGIKISPNPVSGNAFIDYIITNNGRVSIEVVNPQGQLVKTILSTSQIKGQYQLPITHQFDGLAKGIYFLLLKQNERGNVVKFINY